MFKKTRKYNFTQMIFPIGYCTCGFAERLENQWKTLTYKEDEFTGEKQTFSSERKTNAEKSFL
jgi:hypothetical protein